MTDKVSGDMGDTDRVLLTFLPFLLRRITYVSVNLLHFPCEKVCVCVHGPSLTSLTQDTLQTTSDREL